MTTVELKVDQEAGAHLLIPRGELVTGDADARLEKELLRLAADENCRVVIDLSDVTYIDSSVLGKLVYGRNLLAGQGGRLRLLNPPKRVLDLLRVTRLISVFEIFDDRQKALSDWH